MSVSLALALALVLWALMNLITWALFRIDKRRARRALRRIPERRLLGFAFAGGSVGALVAMYAHRRRHKVDKRRFAALAWLAALLHAALLAVASWWLLSPP